MSNSTSKKAVPSTVSKLKVLSNKQKNKFVDLTNGLVRLMYYESVLQDTVRSEVVFADTGNSVDNKSVLEGLPLVGTEDVELEFTDNNDTTVKINLNVNKVTQVNEESTASMIKLDLVSEEFLRNESGSSRLNVRFDGKISDHIRRILTDFLKTEKEMDIEETNNNYNFIGNNRKPYYTLNWLSKASIPTVAGEKGKTGGFFFFETAKGFNFKSIDGLFKQKQKKSLIHNLTTDLPAGYDTKVLDFQGDNPIPAQEKFKMGAYGTRLVVFDPFNCFYEIIEQTANDTKDGTELAAKELPKLNDKFESDSKFTRTTYKLIDTGTLPSGTTQQQIDKATEQNFELQKIMNQTLRRYNQLFTGMQTVTIPGDFNLHAGDVVFLDTPGLRAQKKDDLNKEYGGLYIIADLCHYISPEETYTKLNLVRDSFGRKGNHTTNIPL
tara:strand:+ start:524 stop:1837 length:1314 start_codon:yes stop_codon:yes gene_type:complete